MSATVAVLIVVALIALFLRRADELRRDRLELALEPTCLLCGTKDLVLAAPPDYRCASCDFDTTRVDGLTHELETFRALSWAADELDLAAAHLRRVVDQAQRAQIVGEQKASPIAMETQHVQNALDYLRDVMLEHPTIAECPEFTADRASLDRLHEYREEVQRIRRDLRATILVATTSDGSIATQRDFEHVTDEDYEDL